MEGIKSYPFGSARSLKANGWWREAGTEVPVMGRINDAPGKVTFAHTMPGKGWVGGGGVLVIVCIHGLYHSRLMYGFRDSYRSNGT